MGAILHVGLFDPKFRSPTRSLLETPSARIAVRASLMQTLPQVLRSSTELGAFLRQRLAVA
jgi:hypothetical protein